MKDKPCYTILPLGVIRTPHTEMKGTPIQPRWAEGIRGTIELEMKFVPGLKDIEGFSHIILLYLFDRIMDEVRLTPSPYLDSEPHGIFATRSPWRPNHIGLSVVRLISVTDNMLEIEGVDMLDGTPLLDIKPWVPDFNPSGEIRTGWLEGKTEVTEACAGIGRCVR